MASIIEHGAVWTLTDKAAQSLSDAGAIKVCTHEHVNILPVDLPIYHANASIGMQNIYAMIADAEKE